MTISCTFASTRFIKCCPLARYQSARVHVNSEYDVEVDTQELVANHAALKILAALDMIAPPTAFERLRSKHLVTRERSISGF